MNLKSDKKITVIVAIFLLLLITPSVFSSLGLAERIQSPAKLELYLVINEISFLTGLLGVAIVLVFFGVKFLYRPHPLGWLKPALLTFLAVYIWLIIAMVFTDWLMGWPYMNQQDFFDGLLSGMMYLFIPAALCVLIVFPITWIKIKKKLINSLPNNIEQKKL